jgi:hypothetical protein
MSIFDSPKVSPLEGIPEEQLRELVKLVAPEYDTNVPTPWLLKMYKKDMSFGPAWRVLEDMYNRLHSEDSEDFILRFHLWQRDNLTRFDEQFVAAADRYNYKIVQRCPQFIHVTTAIEEIFFHNDYTIDRMFKHVATTLAFRFVAPESKEDYRILTKAYVDLLNPSFDLDDRGEFL